jgi:large subunit ribosomal protein L18
MFIKKDKKKNRQKIKARIRKKVAGSSQRPRLAVFRSLKHIYAQAVDDTSGRTVAIASSLDKDLKAQGYGGNRAAAQRVGEAIAERLLAKGCETVVFDRGGFLYHGRVKVLAEAARSKGLKF